ncbi:MAG: endonuclease III domain-containing protein [Chloroflexota bacterium]
MTDKHILDSINDADRRQAKYEPVARTLREIYGELQWSDGQSPMDELVSCILSQNTNDANRDRGFTALKQRYPTWQDVVDAPLDELIDTIRPAGLANQKGPRIQRALEQIYRERGEYNIDFLADIPINEAKEWLVSMDGIGPKTAAIVLCFAFNRAAFPVDTHVLRVSTRIGFLPEKTNADRAHDIMEAIVPAEDYFQFHIHLIRHGRDTCNARSPHCERCPLTQHCDYFQRFVK